MTMQPQPEQGGHMKRRIALALLCAAALLIIALAGYTTITYFSSNASTGQKQQNQTATPGTQATAAGTPAVKQQPSPLLFGTNLGLFNTSDQFLTSDATRQMMQQM